VGVDAVQQAGEIGSGERPVERPGDGVVAGLERRETVADLVQAGESLGPKTFRWTTEK
jgi:hypothetical protein